MVELVKFVVKNRFFVRVLLRPEVGGSWRNQRQLPSRLATNRKRKHIVLARKQCAWAQRWSTWF